MALALCAAKVLPAASNLSIPSQGVAAFWGCNFSWVLAASCTTFQTSAGIPLSGRSAALRPHSFLIYAKIRWVPMVMHVQDEIHHHLAEGKGKLAGADGVPKE